MELQLIYDCAHYHGQVGLVLNSGNYCYVGVLMIVVLPTALSQRYNPPQRMQPGADSAAPYVDVFPSDANK